MIVAVYGTLRKGFENHFFLSEGGSRFLGLDSLSGCDLFAGEFAYLTRGTGRAIVELYEVSPQVLARLDELESHPTLYVRTAVRTDGGIEAQSYLIPRERIPPEAVQIAGDWAAASPKRRV